MTWRIGVELNKLLIVRVIQFVLSIILLGLTAAIVNFYDKNTFINAPSEVSFMLFCSIWTWLALLYLVYSRMFLPAIYHAYGVLAVEFVTMIFWFSAFIAVAVWNGNLFVCQGTICGTARAAAVFGAFEWLAWLITFVLAAMEFARSRGASADADVEANK